MKKVGIVYDPIYAKHDTGNYHPECKDRVIKTIKALEQHQMWGKNHDTQFIDILPRQATIDELKWCHSMDLILEVQSAAQSAKDSNSNEFMDGDTPVSGDSFNASLFAAGGNFCAIDAIFEKKVDRAFVICRPPGHHANRDASRGFCLFNNVMLATEYLFKKKNLKKVAILDFDAHAGNGSEDICWHGVPGVAADQELLFISTHQDPRTLYPGTCFVKDIGEGKQKGKIVNVPFAPNSGDESMQLALNKIINPLLNEFKPEFILMSAGFDGHKNDPITSLKFTQQGFGKIVESLLPISNQYANGRISITLEGGYNLTAISNSITNVVSVLSEGKILEIEDDYDETHSTKEYTENELIPEIKETLGPYWKCLK
jgi:acetoin utilization deacetylase AcuC-like enzyme